MGTLIALSWLLTPAEFGIPNVAISIVGVMVILVELGVGSALIQRETIEPEHLGGSFAVVLVVGAAMILVNIFAAKWIADIVNLPELVGPLLAFSVLIVLQPYMTVLDSLVRRSLKFGALSMADIAGSAFGYAGVSLILAVQGWGMWSIVAGQIAAIVIRAAILAYTARTIWTWRTTRQHTKDVLDFGAFFSIGRMATYLGQRFDRVLVGALLGGEAAGLYQRIQNLLMITYRQVTDPLDYVLFPIMSRVQDSVARLWAGFAAGTAGTALLTMPATVIAIVVSPAFVPVVFGPAWTQLIEPLQIMLLITVTRPSDRIANIICRATGEVRVIALINTAYAVMVMAGVAIGYPFGLVGVAWALLVANVIKFWLTNNVIRRTLHISLAKSLTPFVSAVVTALGLTAIALVFLMVNQAWLWTPIGAAVFSVVALAAWAGCCLLLPDRMFPAELVAIRQRIVTGLLRAPKS